MAQTPLGPILDQLGVSMDLDDDVLVASAVVVFTYYEPDDSRPHLALAVSESLGWIEQAGMLRLAERISSDCAERSEGE